MLTDSKFEGLDDFIQAFEKHLDRAEKNIVKTVEKSSESMVKNAKKHKFNTDTGSGLFQPGRTGIIPY